MIEKRFLLKTVLGVLIYFSNIFESIEPCNADNKCDVELEHLERNNLLLTLSVSIINSCFKKIDHNVILRHSPADNNLFLKSVNSQTSPLFLIEPYENLGRQNYLRHHDEPEMTQQNHYGHNFVVLTHSQVDLSRRLNALKNSVWWNHEGLFFIIHLDDSGCEMADSLLQTVWQADILSAVFLCRGSDNHAKMYTFNPFNDFAPKFWSKNRVLQVNQHPWRLFERNLTASDIFHFNFCGSLNFHKTRTLDGYIVKMGAYVHSNLLLFNENQTGMNRFGGVNGDITRTICDHLNASVNVKFYSEMGYVDDYGYFQGFLKDLQTHQIDYAMNMNVQRTTWKQQTYPHETSGFCIVSLKHPLSFMEKFELVFTPQFWLVLGLTFVTTVLILKFVLEQPILLATLHFIKLLLVPSSLKEHSWSFLQRISFLECIVLTMTTNIFFQSCLSSINVIPSSYPTIETVDDLIKSNALTYGTINYKDLFLDSEISDRYKVSDYPTCIKKLGMRENVACIPGCIEAKYSAYESQLVHISNNELREFHMVFSVRKNWPLIKSFNKILRRLSEAGIIQLFRKRESRFFKHDSGTLHTFEKISLENIRFSFVILLLGLFIAFCVFLIEMFLHCVKITGNCIIVRCA